MSLLILRATLVRALLGAALLTAMACTPVQVLTHSVSQNETRVPAGRYDLDHDHCSITFDVDHFKYSRFTMRFDRKQGQLDWNEGGLQKSTAAITIDAASIDTNVPLLDKMVKSTSMLDVARYPEIRFVSTRFERTGESRGTLTGDLTIHGVAQPVTLDVTFNGFARDPLTKKTRSVFRPTVASAARSLVCRRGIRPSATISTCGFRPSSEERPQAGERGAGV